MEHHLKSFSTHLNKSHPSQAPKNLWWCKKRPIYSYTSSCHDISLSWGFPQYSPRAQLSTQIQCEYIEFTNTAKIQQKYKYNTAHEPSPALPVIAQFSRNYPRRPTAFYPKITHRQPLLISTSAPFLWSRLYLMPLCQTQIWQMQIQMLAFYLQFCIHWRNAYIFWTVHIVSFRFYVSKLISKAH